MEEGINLKTWKSINPMLIKAIPTTKCEILSNELIHLNGYMDWLFSVLWYICSSLEQINLYYSHFISLQYILLREVSPYAFST